MRAQGLWQWYTFQARMFPQISGHARRDQAMSCCEGEIRNTYSISGIIEASSVGPVDCPALALTLALSLGRNWS